MPRVIYLSQVYKKIPAIRRICEECGKIIYRNASLADGVLMHFGCLKRANVKPTHICNNCGSFLTPKKIVTVSFKGERAKSCGLCGSQDIGHYGYKLEGLGAL